ncbi:hypothetical protein RJ639_017562 [Escallonia herrerae]|uniref:GAG-pre-integrase domain-containing protein n=1 Tax=Escallonia herrerae TaxID=1293975 RepID=A0AA88VDK7_9ASTE|nr:hypothetical protein RJ639_017562 [Escallonia herrerae]
MRRKTIGYGISSSTALSVESRGRQNKKQNNRGRSPARGRSRSRGKSKSKGKTIVCWNYNKEGHKNNDCTEPKKKKGAEGRQCDDEGANMVSSNEQTYDDLCLFARVEDNSKVWYEDSGASIHCTPHRDCFCDSVHGDYGHVTVGNGYQCSIVGKGKVEIKLSNGGTLVLKDVRHISELQKNLISISGLDREGYFVAFAEKQWKVIKGSMVVVRGERVRTLYTLSGTHNHSISLVVTENQRTTLWHHRLGHLSESGMKILHSKNALPGMKNIQLDFCEDCVYGKQKRVSLRRDGKEKKIERLELVHAYVCGPTKVKSLGAVDTVVYLINRSPASALNGGIPEEEWSGDEYGYCLWDYEHNKIIRSKDVIFDESWLYKHMLQEHGIEKENKEYMELDEPEDGQSLLEDGQLNLEKIEGNKNPADMLTKVVDRQKLSLCSTLISLR